MEKPKPDANGYINVNWPSKSVPHGGIFHTRTVEPSSDRQQFLKVLLEESKLAIDQRKKEKLALRLDNERKAERRPTVQMPTVRPRTSRRRSLSAIRDSGILDLEPFRPLKKGEDREKLKDKLAKTMAYGDSEVKVSPATRATLKPFTKLPTAKEMWHDLLTQIRERAEWLAEMEDLGHAAEHREIIMDQIAERMRALDALGIDSKCSSARSEASGFSTLKSQIDHPASTRSAASSVKEKLIKKSPDNQIRSKSKSGTQDRDSKVENVLAYSRITTPLQYTPRRRV